MSGLINKYLIWISDQLKSIGMARRFKLREFVVIVVTDIVFIISKIFKLDY